MLTMPLAIFGARRAAFAGVAVDRFGAFRPESGACGSSTAAWLLLAAATAVCLVLPARNRPRPDSATHSRNAVTTATAYGTARKYAGRDFLTLKFGIAINFSSAV